VLSFLKSKKTDPAKGLKEALGDYTLPSFPAIILETLERLRNPDSSAASDAEVMSVDPGLSVRALQLSNSAAIAPMKRIESLTHAIALVGFSRLESLVLSLAVGRTLPRESSPGYEFPRFWHTSAKRGFLAGDLARVFCPAKESECFTAGFLQDMAIPFLSRHRPKEYGSILEQWHEGEEDLAELERAIFPWDHAEVASWLCNEWSLSETISTPIKEHHTLLDEEDAGIEPVALVALLRETAQGLAVDAVIEKAASECDIPIENMRELVNSSLQAAGEFSRLMV